MKKTNKEARWRRKPQRASLLVFCETKQAASDSDLFLYGAAIISHRISLSRVVRMCETNDAEMSEEAYSFDLPPELLLHYCSAIRVSLRNSWAIHHQEKPAIN
jgi:hypothetical protein